MSGALSAQPRSPGAANAAPKRKTADQRKQRRPGVETAGDRDECTEWHRSQARHADGMQACGSQSCAMSIATDELRHRVRTRSYRSVVNQAHFDQATWGERLADGIANWIGSWRFLIVQTILVLLWVSLNLVGIGLHWDPYPFILLNLMFSVQAAYTGPILLLAGNRQNQKDRMTLEHAAGQADRVEHRDRQILTEIKRNTELTVAILRNVQGDAGPESSTAGGVSSEV